MNTLEKQTDLLAQAIMVLWHIRKRGMITDVNLEIMAQEVLKDCSDIIKENGSHSSLMDDSPIFDKDFHQGAV